ncbi:hypothetical protein ACFL5Z_06885 [Planctomycetota bacterium]
MSDDIRGTYLCLLDDVNLEDSLTLDEFDLRYVGAEEIISFLKGSDQHVSSEERHRLEAYAEFPWARMERIISPDKIMNDFDRHLCMLDLAWKHAGTVSWEPFTELIRTLHLLKESPGPIITRQFYFTLFPNATTKAEIGKVIYGEPSFDIIQNGSGSRIRPRLLEYALGPKDVAGFSNLRKQLKECLSKDSDLPNSHLRIAIHYFENGDRRLKAPTLTGSFNAIDPLMSYDAALEALVIPEKERSPGKKLVSRVSVIIGEKDEEVRNFIKRVFWLRSKVAHGVRTVEEIEDLIINKPDAKIEDEKRSYLSTPKGNYKELFLTGYEFAGFLVNLREITRRTIRFFCDEHLKGRNREDTIDSLS